MDVVPRILILEVRDIILLLANLILSSANVTTASQAAAEIGTTLQAHVEISKPLEKILVLVEPHGADPKHVLTALTSALHASLRKTDSGYRIERTKSDLAQLRQERAKERAGWLKRRIDNVAKYRKIAIGTGGIDSAYFGAITHMNEQIAAFSQRKSTVLDPYYPEQVLPTQALIEGLIARIGYSNLGQLPSGQVKVYEDSPVDGAARLPDHDDMLQAFESAMLVLRTAAVSPENRQTVERMRLGSQVAEWNNTTPVSRLRLVELANENGMTFQLEGFDDKGHQVASGAFDVGPVDSKQTTKVLLMGIARKPDVKMAPLSAEALDAVRFAAGDRRSSLPPWFLTPEKTEPMNLFVREALEGLAEENPAQPVVFALSDALWSNVRQCVQGDKVNLDGLKASTEIWSPYEKISGDGFTAWRPKDFEIDESRHADRRILARFARNFQTEKRADVREVVRLYHDASAETSPLSSAWATEAQLSAGLTPIVNSSLGEDFYQVLGAINDDAWRRLAAGDTMTASEAGVENELRSYLDGALYQRTEGGAGISDIERHPAELIASQPVGKLLLSFHAGDLPLMKVWNTGQPEPGGAQPMEQFKAGFRVHAEYFTFQGDTPTLSQTRQQFEDSFIGQQFRECRQSVVDVTLGLPRGQHITGRVLGNTVATSDAFSYADFPLEFRDAAWKQARDLGLADAQNRRNNPSVPTKPPTSGQKTIPPTPL